MFVSSTFRDMHEEREILIKHIFPQLRRLCERRGIVWADVDLRWGVTEEESRQGKVVRFCLDEIDRCRPFFIGLLGQRYGWVPRQEDLARDPELLEKYPWVAGKVREGCSVTELEIEHGVLRNPTRTGTNFFYIRDADYRPTSVDDEPPTDCQERQAESQQRLAALKLRLRSGDAWSCMDYADPAALGRQILGDLTALLDRLYPAGEIMGSLQQEAAVHRAFANARARSYVGRQVHLDRVTAHATGKGPPLIISGEVGAGKSALIGNWLRRWQGEPLDGPVLFETWWRRAVRTLRHRHGGEGEGYVLLHCVGATPQSTTWTAFARRVVSELTDHFGLRLDVPTQPAPLRTAFAQALALASARGRVILILDGLDQLTDREGPAALSWLPQDVPSAVRLIVSCRRGPVLDELRSRRWAELELKSLGRRERRALVRTFLAHYGKRLSASAVELIVGAAPAATPLYLRTLLEELRVLGRHEELPARLRHYLSAATTAELYARALKRWEEDFEAERPRLVRDTMTLLWASRAGLTEPELLELLKAPGDPLPSAVWSPLHLSAEALLINSMGLLTFVHPQVRAAVERAYLPAEEARRQVRRRLADYFARAPWSPRTVEELPWQLTELAAWTELAALLADAQFLARAWATYPQQLKAYWARVVQASPLRLVDAHRWILDAPERQPEAAWALTALLADTGHVEESLNLGARLEAQARLTGDLARVQSSLSLRAAMLARRGDVRGGMHLLREQEDICRQRGDWAALAVNIGNQGAFLRDLGETDQALAQHHEAEELCRRLEDWVGVAASLGNQGVLRQDRGDGARALELFREQEALCRAQGDVAGLQVSLGNQAAALREQGQQERALQLHREEESLCRLVYNREGLQKCLGNQARLLQDNEDYDGALACLKERETICRQDGYRADLAKALFQQASLFGVRLGAAEHGRRLAEEALLWAESISDSGLVQQIQKLVAHLRARI